MPTRRNLIGAGAAAALAAGCGGRRPRRLAGSAADIPVLQERLDAERAQIAVAEVALERIRGAALPHVRTILRHDRAHAGALAESIRELGGTPRAPSGPGPDAPALVSRNPDEALAELIRSKEHAATLYERAIPQLVNPRLRATFGSIMTAEGEHAAVLAKAL